ncbi:MAG: class I SAM-dependent methyltransferase [Actinomycetota bacterium]|nr:class I SAM-dependent methyltransferase [Actinomycetota bacterium]
MPPTSDASSYDAVLYPARPLVQTHPDRLATLATLLGLSPPPPGRCRVLELGCGAGGNLLPMAAALPGATFVGIDNASVPIARARSLTERLGLGNVRFDEIAIEEYEPPDEGFDYVIAHGVYSWVPDHVRDALLALCARALSGHGIAYVSYNALPGGYLRQALREMLAFHLGDLEAPAERIAAARGFLRLLGAAHDSDEELAATLGPAARELLDHEDALLFHDTLADCNQPFSFHDFIARAQTHGLRFLTEAQFSETQVGALAPPLQRALLAFEDPLRREQYLDFLKERKFRQTLLCRTERAPERTPRAETLRGLAVSAALRWKADEESGRVTFVGPGDAHVTTDHPLVVRTLETIGRSWPDPVWIAQLGSERELPAMCDALVRCFGANLVRLHVHPPRVSTSPPERPRVSPVARLEATEGPMLTTVRHTHHRLDDDLGRRVAALLDGTRDRPALLAALQDDGAPASDELAAAIDAALGRLADAGLLLCDDA